MDNHFAAFNRTLHLPARDKDVAGNPFVVRHHKAVLLTPAIEANNLRVSPGQDPDNLSFRPDTGTFIDRADNDAVAIHCPLHIFLMDIDIHFALVIRNQEAEALSVTLQSATQEVHPLRQPKVIGSRAHNLATILQLVEQLHKGLKLSSIADSENSL